MTAVPEKLLDRMPPAVAGRAGLLRPLAVTAAAAAAVGYVAAVDPNHAGHYPTCPFLYVTGYYCPGCGSLRALHALAHGHVGEAFGRNPLAVSLLPLVLVLYGLWVRRSITGAPRRWAAPAWTIWALLALIMAFWVLRNLPWFAFLAP